MNIQILNESVFKELKKSDLNKKENKINNISLLGAFSKNNRIYTQEALESAVQIFEGSPAFYIHSQKDRNPRKELIGKFTDLKVKNSRVKGTLNVLEKESDFIFDLADRMPELAGFSVNATVKYRKEGKQEIIEEFLRRKSVDLVTDPATVQGLFESQEKIDDKNKEKDYMTEIEVKKIQESLVNQTEQIKNLTENLEKEKIASKKILEGAQEKVAILEKEKLIEKKIKESKLPIKSISELFKQQLLHADEKKIDALIKDRKEILEVNFTNILRQSEYEENKGNDSGKVSIENIMEEIKNS